MLSFSNRRMRSADFKIWRHWVLLVRQGVRVLPHLTNQTYFNSMNRLQITDPFQNSSWTPSKHYCNSSKKHSVTSLSASCWNCNSVLKAFKMSFEMDQLSGDDSSSWSKFGSSDEEVHELLVEQEALSDVIFWNPLTACVCSRKTTWRRKFIDFMNFNERFLINYNELDLQTSEVT